MPPLKKETGQNRKGECNERHKNASQAQPGKASADEQTNSERQQTERRIHQPGLYHAQARPRIIAARAGKRRAIHTEKAERRRHTGDADRCELKPDCDGRSNGRSHGNNSTCPPALSPNACRTCP